MFSKSTEYALRAVIYIAKYGSADNKLSLEAISSAIDSPQSFTAKILQKLTKNNALISSVTGPRGGFFMTESSKKANLMYILTLLDSDTVISKCVMGLNDCSDVNPCPMHEQYKNIKPQLIEMFETKTIENLIQEMTDEKLTFKNPEI
jgi:Rrf2 family protein